MKICFLGIFGVVSYNGIAGILRALGDSITPLIFLIVASILNVVLDLVFVVGFYWGVPGVAIATVISQFVSGISCIIYALYKIEILRVPVKELKPDREILSKCIRLGIPVALQNSFVSVSMMALQFVVNGFQATVMAAYTVVNRIEQLVIQPFASLGAAVASFTGQNIGARKIDRVKKGIKSAVLLIFAFSIIMLPAMYFGGEYIMRLFTKKEDIDVVRYGVEGIRITSLFYSFVGLIFITRNFLSGAGDIKITMIMGLIEVVVRVIVSIHLSKIIGFQGIFWASALNWFITGLFGGIRVLSGKWMNKSIINRS
jgi:putative MATE family efflux protein